MLHAGPAAVAEHCMCCRSAGLHGLFELYKS